MAKVILLCGKVAAGKTTYAKEMAKKQRAVILSIDDLVVRLNDHCEGRERLSAMETAIRDYFADLIVQLIEQNVTCILDHGHWTRASRQQMIEFCQTHDLPLRIILLECPKDVRLKRLQKRNEQLLRKQERGYVIDAAKLERFDSWFEALNDEECQLADIVNSGMEG